MNAMSIWGGGSSRTYYSNLLRELGRDPRGFDFTVLAPQGELAVELAGAHALVQVPLPGKARTVARVLYEQSALPIRALRFDLLYCPSDVLPVWGATRTVVALRNLNIYDRRWYDDARTRVLNLLVRTGLPRARGIVVPSHAAAKHIAERLGLSEDRIDVVPHGISREAFEPDADSAPHDAPYLFYPANLERHKNFEVLFQALLRLDVLGLELWIAGSRRANPDWAAHLERLAESMQLGSRVRFLAHIPYSEILRYYRGAVALVFPSVLESFGHPLLEAMLAGTPIVASDTPSLREVAGDVALYFPSDDPERLARAVARVIQEPEPTRARVERGRQRVAKFSLGR